MAKDYDLFAANKVLLQFSFPKDSPMLMSELEVIHTFIEMFSSEIECKWGFVEIAGINKVQVVIIASNLKKK